MTALHDASVSRCVLGWIVGVCVVQVAGIEPQRAEWQHPVDAGQLGVSTVSSIVCAVVGDGVCSGVHVADSRSCVPLLPLWLLCAAAVVGVGAVVSSDVAATVDVVVCECVCDARRSMFVGVCVCHDVR